MDEELLHYFGHGNRTVKVIQTGEIGDDQPRSVEEQPKRKIGKMLKLAQIKSHIQNDQMGQNRNRLNKNRIIFYQNVVIFGFGLLTKT